MRTACLVFVVCAALACGLAPTGTPEAPAGALLYQDDFSSPLSGWDRYRSAEGIMDYDGGVYHIRVNALNVNFWSTPRRHFADVRVEVDAAKLAGPDENRIGLLCRLRGNAYYFFLISSDGYYGVGLFNEGNGILLGQSEMQPSDKIHTGMAINHLRADCHGETLTFYVNGFPLAQVQDGTLREGDVGLLAGTFGQPGVDVVYDRFLVLEP